MQAEEARRLTQLENDNIRLIVLPADADLEMAVLTDFAALNL